jgi:signal transduction histidine kinase
LVATALLWICGALLAANFILSALFRGYVERTFDAQLESMLTALIAGANIGPGDQLSLRDELDHPRFHRPYSGWYWQISNRDSVIFRSRSLWDEILPQRQASRPGPVMRSTVRGPKEEAIRLAEQNVAFPRTNAVFHFAVAGNASEIAEEIDAFDQTLIWSLAVLGLGLGAAIVVQVRYGLWPMRTLHAQVGDIRSGRADRLSGDFPQEVTPLVQELNAMLEHNAAMVEQARTHVGDLAHALKTPLSVLSAELDSSAGPSHDVMKQEIAKIRGQVDHYLARAQTAASAKALGVRTSVLPVVEAVKRTLERIHIGRSVTISLTETNGAVFRGQSEDLEEIVGNLIENGCKWARSEVRVRISEAAGRVVLTIDDDGPGLGPQQRAAVLERGTRLDEAAPGSGLGLAIVRDIVTAYGGKLHLDEAPIGGLRATVALPSAE